MSGMKYGYARVSTDGQSVAAQVAALHAAGATRVFREVASGAKTARPGDDPLRPDHWTCRACAGKRWWRAHHERGNAALGYVTRDYRVTTEAA